MHLLADRLMEARVVALRARFEFRDGQTIFKKIRA